ncbi:MAG TPA: amidohydrolase family protein [Aliidongia sp.]|nr:amidohydrolase family protein [Aliidongia sp.]
METKLYQRRSVLGLMAGSAAAGMLGVGSTDARAEDAVPWSRGTELPKAKAPADATDCHHHIYDHRWPIDPNSTIRPPDATVAEYRLLQKRIGTTRHVVVQPSAYGVDNTGLVEVLGEFGLKTTRGVAVVNDKVTDAELEKLHAAGVRGIRFNLANPGGATAVEMIEPLAKRIGPRGWHIQLNMTADQIAANAALWDSIPCPSVFDHLGHLPEPQDLQHPAFAVIVGLLKKGKGWVKLSGLYIDSKAGPPYADRAVIAKAYLDAAPGQLVWGSDWPHPTEKPDDKPDDALLFDLLMQSAPDKALQERVLVTNPAKLYGFS